MEIYISGTQKQIEAILAKTSDAKEATRLGFQQMGVALDRSSRSPLSSPSQETLKVWRLTELGFAEDLAFNALMAAVCLFFSSKKHALAFSIAQQVCFSTERKP